MDEEHIFILIGEDKVIFASHDMKAIVAKADEWLGKNKEKTVILQLWKDGKLFIEMTKNYGGEVHWN